MKNEESPLSGKMRNLPKLCSSFFILKFFIKKNYII